MQNESHGSAEKYMPLSFQKQINEATKIGLWHITEPEDFFSEKVSLQRNISHPHKRLQHLAGRYLLRELFPEFPLSLVLIADTKKPFLADEAFHFSLSHCGDFAAAIVSTKNRVGVDIEIPHPKIERVSHKFLSRSEQRIIAAAASPYHAGLTTAWSIKEAIFKWYGNGGVDFIGHIEICDLQKNETGFIATCFFKKEVKIKLILQSIMHENNNLSWLVT